MNISPAQTSHARESVATHQAALILAAVVVLPAFVSEWGPPMPPLLILLMAAASVVAGWKFFEYFCRPVSTQYGKAHFQLAAGSLIFTATAGIALLSLFMFLADHAVEHSGPRGGILGILYGICKYVGAGYRSVGSQSSVARFFAYLISVAPCEEICKLIPVIFAIRSSKPGTLAVRDLLFIAAASGLGFGVAEGIDYSYRTYSPTSAPLGTYLLRFSSCAFGHSVYTMLSALILFHVRDIARGPIAGGQYAILVVIGFLVLVTLPSAAIHALYNSCAHLPLAPAIDVGAIYLVSLLPVPKAESLA